MSWIYMQPHMLKSFPGTTHGRSISCCGVSWLNEFIGDTSFPSRLFSREPLSLKTTFFFNKRRLFKTGSPVIREAPLAIADTRQEHASEQRQKACFVLFFSFGHFRVFVCFYFTWTKPAAINYMCGKSKFAKLMLTIGFNSFEKCCVWICGISLNELTNMEFITHSFVNTECVQKFTTSI